MSEEKKESEIKWHQFEQRMCKIALTEGREASEVLDEQARAEKLWDAMVKLAASEYGSGRYLDPVLIKAVALDLLKEWEKGSNGS